MGRVGLWSVGQAVAILVGSLVCLPSGFCADTDDSAAMFRLETLLESKDPKDLGSALTQGQAIRDRSLRDRALRLVADAQLAAGDYPVSVHTAAYISDDRRRDRTLRRLAEQAARSPNGNAGGGAQADFETLIELMQSTVEPESWEELGGAGTAAGFPGGVLVDTNGVLARVETEAKVALEPLIHSEVQKDGSAASFARDLKQQTNARRVSLRRLERQLQQLTALGMPAEPEMRNLAGLWRLEYVAVVEQGTPEADIVLIGPAGEWTTDTERRCVNVETGRPVLQLDDLVILLRNAFRRAGGIFGCSITPRDANLASAQKYLKETSDRPLKPGQREPWLTGLREQLGEQDIVVHGIDPSSHAARVLVEADYRMKLVGMGIEEGVPGVTSYLDRIEIGPDGTVTPMTVLRWWFALSDDMVRTNPGRDVFALPEQSVQVLSENELLTRTGKRVHTGKSDDLNRAFAADFTAHFAELAEAYPIYAELQNVFDLALVAAVLKADDLPAQIGWEMTCFVGQRQSTWLTYRPASRDVPRTVETVLNHRLLDRKHIVAGVSGGVLFERRHQRARAAIPGKDVRSVALIPPDDVNVWWWDSSDE